MSVCTSCAAPVRWEVTQNGKRMPLDTTPRDDGNVVVEHGVARVLTKAELAPGSLQLLAPRYWPHHATCPQGRQWKKVG